MDFAESLECRSPSPKLFKTDFGLYPDGQAALAERGDSLRQDFGLSSFFPSSCLLSKCTKTLFLLGFFFLYILLLLLLSNHLIVWHFGALRHRGAWLLNLRLLFYLDLMKIFCLFAKMLLILILLVSCSILLLQVDCRFIRDLRFFNVMVVFPQFVILIIPTQKLLLHLFRIDATGRSSCRFLITSCSFLIISRLNAIGC